MYTPLFTVTFATIAHVNKPLTEPENVCVVMFFHSVILAVVIID